MGEDAKMGPTAEELGITVVAEPATPDTEPVTTKSKRWTKSKMVIVNSISAALGTLILAGTTMDMIKPLMDVKTAVVIAASVFAATGLLNIALRFITTTPIWEKPE